MTASAATTFLAYPTNEATKATTVGNVTCIHLSLDGDLCTLAFESVAEARLWLAETLNKVTDAARPVSDAAPGSPASGAATSQGESPHAERVDALETVPSAPPAPNPLDPQVGDRFEMVDEDGPTGTTYTVIGRHEDRVGVRVDNVDKPHSWRLGLMADDRPLSFAGAVDFANAVAAKLTDGEDTL